MAALTADRYTDERLGRDFYFPVKAATKIYAGSIVVLDGSGWAKPGVGASGLVCVGIAQAFVDNTIGAAANGSQFVKVRFGTFKLGNPAMLTKTSIGGIAYVVDDNNVNATSSSQSLAGIIVDVDGDGQLWVSILCPPVLLNGLAAANNLSDVNDAATALTNLGANKVRVSVSLAALLSSGAATYYTPAPCTGTLTKIYVAIDGALATGNGSVTASIGGTGVTNGVVTLTQAASAAGSLFSATPTALNAVTEGTSVVELLIGGSNSATVAGFAILEFTLPAS